MNNPALLDTFFVASSDSLIQAHYIILSQSKNGDDSQLTTNLITIGIALVAALLALYQVKSNVISSSRIQWIENLRESISAYCTEVIHCSTLAINFLDEVKEKNDVEAKNATLANFYPVYLESAIKSNLIGTKVLLYLNSKEKEHKRIEDIIGTISKRLHEDKVSELNTDEIDSLIREIISESKKIFKKEWSKSKKLWKI